MVESIMSRVRQFLVDDEGPTAVEYCVMLMLIVLVCITSIQAIGDWAGGSFQGSSDKINDATS